MPAIFGIPGLVICVLLISACTLPEDPWPDPQLIIVNMADLHSAHDAYPGILATVRQLSEQHDRERLVVLINGDIFEPGNAVARRSEAQGDWAFLTRLTEHAKVVTNLGNHEFDFLPPDKFMARAEALGLAVIGNIGTRERPNLAPGRIDLDLDGETLAIIGLGTDAINTYPQALRDELLLPDPVTWMHENHQRLTEGVDHLIIASHAGIVADRAISEHLAGDSRILFYVGGHNHMMLHEDLKGIPYMHNGFGGEMINITAITKSGGTIRLDSHNLHLAEMTETDPDLSALLASLDERYLDEDDLRIIGKVEQALTLSEAAAWAAEQISRATDADISLVNHTSFGAGLPAGGLPQFRFDAFLRFDNPVMVATVKGPTLRSILALNDPRNGHYLYASPLQPADEKEYVLATTRWVAMEANQERYLGTRLVFEEVTGLTTRQILLQALKETER